MPVPAARLTDDAGAEPYRVMLVDDSAAIRGFFRRALESDSGIRIVAAVGNGQTAIDTLRRVRAEIVVLDIDMPVMDGLTALPGLLAIDPSVKIIMASALCAANADISLKALSLGAADYIPKPEAGARRYEADSFRHELVGKVRVLGRARRGPSATGRLRLRGLSESPSERLARGGGFTLRPPSALPPAALAIGCSTGGPQALLRLIAGLGADFGLPVLITQHMPAAFTGILAAHLAKAAGREAREAADGEAVRAGGIYVAPGNFHMLVEGGAGDAVIRLSQAPPENFCRPSVDPMLRSMAETWGGRLLAAILTGMGHDGLGGAHCVVERGGTVIAQDEATSAVWGMPGAVAAAGYCSAVLPLDALAAKVRLLCGRAAA